MANIQQFTRTKYSLDWPVETPDHVIELIMWKHWKEEPFASHVNTNPWDHVLRGGRMLYSPKQLVIHPWLEVQARSWTMDEFAIWWGCSGSGKSHSLGFFAFLDYITDPECTYTCLASTTKDMLMVRSFASVVKYLGYLKSNKEFDVPLKFVAQSCSVIPSSVSDDQVIGAECRIKGVAVKQGTVEEARANLQGVHTRYVRLVLDELAAMPAAAMDARHNLGQCFDFKVFGAANPESLYDQAGIFGVPDHPEGWASVDVDTLEWKSRHGRVYRFDAYRSPGIKEPELYGFLPTQATIKRILDGNEGNEDAPQVWTFLRAFPAPNSLDRTVLSEGMVKKYNMLEPATLEGGSIKVAALDSSFTEGGDDCTYTCLRIGKNTVGRMVIDTVRQVNIPILASSDMLPLDQIVTGVLALMDEDGVPIERMAVDDTGTQSVADAIEMRRGRGLIRFDYGAKAPELPSSPADPTPASKKFRNTVTWLWFLAKQYAEHEQVKNLPMKVAEQMCKRRIKSKLRPLQLESKADMKTRIRGRSPDAADSYTMAVGVARIVLGLLPGSADWAPSGAAPPLRDDVRARLRQANNLSTRYGT